MRRSRFLALPMLAFALLFTACATTNNMTVPATPATTPQPSADKAVIVFMRPSAHAGTIGAVVMRVDGDKEELLTALDYRFKVAVAVPPGEHRFLILNSFGNSGGMMSAKVDAGKTYYVIGAPAGWPAALFGLYPVKADAKYKFSLASDDVKKWIAELDARQPAPGGSAWMTERGARVKEFRAKFEPQWNARTDNKTDEFVLQPQDGR